MNELVKVFESEEFGKVRTVLKDGEPWFVAADVCKVLGQENPTVVVSSLATDEKAKFNLGLQGSPATIISEPGFYRIVMRSRKPVAEPFQRWITHEVIPQIRKTGGYIPVAKEDDDLTIMSKAMMIMQKTLEKKDSLIAEMKPKVEYHDAVIDSHNEYTSTSIAKNYGMSAQQLNRYLHDKHIIYSQDGIWNLYQKYANSGIAHVRYTQNFYGNIVKQLKWTEQGKKFIHNILQYDGYEIVSA